MNNVIITGGRSYGKTAKLNVLLEEYKAKGYVIQQDGLIIKIFKNENIKGS